MQNLQKIVIIDNDDLFRSGLTRLVDSCEKFTVVANFDIESLDDVQRTLTYSNKPDLIIVDPPVQVDENRKFCKKLVQKFRGVPVMILSNNYARVTIVKAIETGISAFYSKTISTDKLFNVITDLCEQQEFADIKLESKIRSVLVDGEVLMVSFSKIEEEVLELVCDQKSNAEISEILGVSARTVESRKRSMMQRTGCKNMIGVIVLYLKNKNQLEHAV